MSAIKLSVLVTLCLLSPAAGLLLQAQRGQQTDSLNPATCFEAVVVEPRKIKSIATALSSAANANKTHFAVFTIAHGQNNGDYVRELVRNDTKLRQLEKHGKLRFLSLPFEDLGGDRIAEPGFPDAEREAADVNLDLGHHDQYSRVLKSKEFWKGFTCDRILLLQSDTTLCANAHYGLEYFSEYEYIGGYNQNAAHGMHYLPGRLHLNGGFSFRNRHGMLRCIDAVDSMSGTQLYWFNHLPEDAFFSNCVELKQPTIGTCKMFAIDGGAQFIGSGRFVPLGVHKPWQDSGCPGCGKINMQMCDGATKLQCDLMPNKCPHTS